MANSPTGEESPERRSFIELTRSLAGLPLDQTAAALESSAAIASISLRAGIEFLRAVPAAAQILRAAELRSWGELGRRLAMSDYEQATTFFAEGVGPFKLVPIELHEPFFALCVRQMTLSTAVGRETFRTFPDTFARLNDVKLTQRILEVATEIARRSAKHSSEFLNSSGAVVQTLTEINDPDVTERALQLAAAFASRAGGIAADAWSALPAAVAGLSPQHAIRLLDTTQEFLERGGGAALHILLAGGEILRVAPAVFDEWIELLLTMATHGNASLVALVRSSPQFIRLLLQSRKSEAVELARRVLNLTRTIAAIDGEAALAAFKSSARALHTVSIEQFEEWAQRGLATVRADARARRSYFSLETRGSYDALHTGSTGLSLDTIQHLLRLYVEALTGREVEIAPLAAVPDEARIGDGRTIHLPSLVNEFGDEELDFRLYKVLAAHGAGQIEFGTYEQDGMLRHAYAAIQETYDPKNVDAIDAFALPDEMVQTNPQAVEEPRSSIPANVDYRAVLQLFPAVQLARRIFGTLENGRIDRRLRHAYRGLRRDLDLIREHLKPGRPRITELPATMVPFELLFQITLLGGAREDARHFYGQVISELEMIVADHLTSAESSITDTLIATSRVYELFKSTIPTEDSVQQVETEQEESQAEDDPAASSERMNGKISECRNAVTLGNCSMRGMNRRLRVILMN
jgi:nitric oxide reductase NorD protein